MFDLVAVLGVKDLGNALDYIQRTSLKSLLMLQFQKSSVVTSLVLYCS